MIWLKKTFPRYGAEWAADQDRLMDLMMHFAAKGKDEHRLITMFSVQEDCALPTKEDIYLCLPDPAYAAFFPDYSRAECVPKVVTSLIATGDACEFERLFKVRGYA